MNRREIILTNYRRPWNMSRLVQTCLSCSNVDTVTLIDNSGDEENLNLDAFDSSSLKVITMARNAGAGHRFELASALDPGWVLCLDDDIFLTSVQIEILFAKSERDNGRLHGCWGQIVEQNNGKIWLRGGIQGTDVEVDIINRAYCFHTTYAKAAIDLAFRLGYQKWDSIGPIDDLLMSYAGRYRPLCHNLGIVSECPSSNSDQIAVWRRPGFHKARTLEIARITELRGDHQCALPL